MNGAQITTRWFAAGFRSCFFVAAIAFLFFGHRVEAQNLTELYSFPIGPTDPNGSLLQASDGNFYGVAGGGTNVTARYGFPAGTIFKMTTNGDLSVVVNFGGTNGASPHAGLIEGKDGNLYGTTSSVFGNSHGTIFKLTPEGTLTTLATFGRTNGYAADGKLVEGSDSNFYGITISGGTNEMGTAFQITPEGKLSTLASFGGPTELISPRGSLVEGDDRKLYGVTGYDLSGTNSFGAIFRFDTNGVIETVFKFNGTNGAYPTPLVKGKDGNFYGTTVNGGPNDFGTIFRLSVEGELTTLVTMPYQYHDPSQLMQAQDGFFYGVADNRIVFRTDTNGILTTVCLLDSSVPAWPVGPIIQADDGNFYGLADYRGGGHRGMAYKFTAEGALSTFASFDDYDLPSGLTEGSDGNFYGTTSQGGTNANWTVFQFTREGGFTTLAQFSREQAAYPTGLVEGPDGNFYAAVYENQTPWQPIPLPYETNRGGLIRLTKAGELTRLLDFNYTNGAGPGKLVLGPNGFLYGATLGGGTNQNGTVFRLSTNGTLQTLVSFTYNQGKGPSGLMCGSDGNLYGALQQSGSNAYGAFFKMTPAGAVTCFPLTDATGWIPTSPLVEGAGGTLYATTRQGGAFGYGTFLKLTSDGTVTAVVSAEYYNFYEGCPVVQGSDGNFYSAQGSFLSFIATMTPQGSMAGAVSFRGTNGAGAATLFRSTDGALYGTTSRGGSRGGGTIFKLEIPASLPIIVNQPYSQTVIAGTNAAFSTDVIGNQTLWFQWQKNGTNIPNATTRQLIVSSVTTNDAGPYRVVITNSFGAATSMDATLTVVLPPPPQMPTQLLAVALTSTSISLRWTNNETNVSSFVIWRGNSSDNTFSRIITLPSSARAFTNYNLAPATTYFYAIQAVNAGGTSAKSAAANARTRDVQPEPPLNLVAYALIQNRVGLSWKKGSTNTTGFIILRGNQPEGPYDVIATVGAGTFTYVDRNVLAGSTYNYVVNAVNSVGTASSSPARVTLPAGLDESLIFQNTNGAFSVWVMNQTNFVRYASILKGPDANTGWRVTAFADFNSDNNTDILWQNSNGDIMTWLMQGTNYLRRQFLRSGNAASTGWKIYAATDLTGDGKTDLLWRNSNSGSLKYWQMNGTNFVTEHWLRTGQPATNGWTIAGTADLDANGSADIIWSNTNGANAVWLMNRTNYLRSVGLRGGYTAATGWKLSLLTDLNSDRKTDIVWEKNDGRLEAWLMNGTNFVRSVTLRSNAGAISGWRLVGPR